jgi:carboxylate-amine ligase
VADFTVGVEEEYQLVSPRTGELMDRAHDVLEADWSGDLHPENQQTMLETGTAICASAAELEQEIRRLRLQVASAAAAEDLRSLAAGIHPFSRWQGHAATAGERYAKLAERYGRVIQSEHIFGMHVHVAVPEGVDRAVVMNRVRDYIPHLLALSASSPVYEGSDTGSRTPVPRPASPPRTPSAPSPPCWCGPAPSRTRARSTGASARTRGTRPSSTASPTPAPAPRTRW